MKRYVIGLDYGTDSARGLLVDAVDGCELASAVVPYRRWGRGEYCDASKSQFRAASLGLCRGSRRAVALVARAVPRSIRRRGGHCRRHDIEHTVSCRREDASAGTSGRSSPTIPTLCSFCGKTIRPSARRRGSMPHAASRRHAIRCSRADTTRRRVIGLRSYIY